VSENLLATASPEATPPQRRTLMRQLLAWGLGAMLIVWLSFVYVGWRTGVHEADELTDGHLASVATLVLNLRVNELVNPANLAERVPMPELKKHDYQQSLSVFIWARDGHLQAIHGDAPVPAFREDEGFADVQLGQPPRPWRSFAQWDPERQRRVMVLIDLGERDDLAGDIAEQLTEPGMWLLPVITLALGLAIWRGLRPLYELSEDVARLDPARDRALPARHALREFDSVIDSINGLLRRQRDLLERERRFANEVAHEMRTPLASIALQSRALRGGLDAAERERALAQIEADALRAGHVLTQLLSLARADRLTLAQAAQPVDLGELAARVVGEYAQAAWQGEHELAVNDAGAVWVNGHAGLVEIALRNLVENVLRHTPAGTRAEVCAGQDDAGAWLCVRDDGASRPQAPRPHRADSLGLGHKIITRVAEVHGARFEAWAGEPPYATGWRLWFPAEAIVRR
jgi:two-component system sensor histidine kinase QseC